jgi:hypothetical protein
MVTPNEITKTDAFYQALAGTTDAGTGLTYPAANASAKSTPTIGTQRRRMYRRIAEILGRMNQGRVVQEDNLKVGVYPLDYLFKGTLKAFTGATNVTVVDNATNYLYIDSANTLIVNQTGFAEEHDCVRLAIVTAASGAITAMTDLRPVWTIEPKTIGRVAAVAAVDFKAVQTVTLFTVPAGKTFIPEKIVIRNTNASLAAWRGTFGQSTAKTDFLGTQNLDNITATGTGVAILQPVPATSPVQIRQYAAGTLFVMDTITPISATSGTATVDVFGYLI